MAIAKHYGYLLLLCTGLFFLRVLGQILVTSFQPRWLPPMSEWSSGLIPYPVLLPIQCLILLIMGVISYNFIRAKGYFTVPKPRLGYGVIWFSYIYFGSMVARYIIVMSLHPERRWFGGTIPIFFHFVLAYFLFIVGRYHTK